MEASALVCGEYSSGDENTDMKGKGIQSDVNYEEVGMDIGSSSASDTEDEKHDGLEVNNTEQGVDVALFSSKEEYEAYQNQFKDKSHKDKAQNTEEKSEYGELDNKNVAQHNHTEYGGNNENDEYGRCQPSKSKNTKSVNSPEIPQSSAREPHRRTNQFQKNDNEDDTRRDEIKQKQPNKR